MQHLLRNLILSSLSITSAVAVTATHAAENAIGAGVSSNGLAVQFTRTIDWQLRDGDQLQWRALLSGGGFDDVDDLDIGGNDYEGDVDTTGLQLGVDWYPFSHKRFQSVFVSGGVSYVDYSVEATSERNQVLAVGNQLVIPSDNVVLNATIDDEQVAPYLSIGWGNRLRADRNWYFQTEAGVQLSSADPSVQLTATDPNNVVTANNLAAEKADITDDFEHNGFVNFTVSYRF